MVTADDAYCLKNNDNLYPDLFDKFEDGMRLDNTGMTRLAGMRLPGYYSRWHLKAYWNITRSWRGRKFDRILTFAEPMISHVLGLWLKKKYKCPWIAFFSDPWVDNPFKRLSRFKRTLNEYCEKKVMEQVDMAVFTCPEALQFYVRKYPFLQSKATFIEHAFDESLYEDVVAKNPDEIVIRHIGALYGERDPSLFLEAIQKELRSREASGIRVTFETIGFVEEDIEKKIARILTDACSTLKVVMRKTVSYRESLRLMKQADLLVAVDMQHEDNIFLMSKLIDYLGAGRPVLAIAPKSGATIRIMRKVGGWVIAPHDIESMKKCVKEILDSALDGTLVSCRPSANEVHEYSITKQIGKLEQIIEKEYAPLQNLKAVVNRAL
ncbi:MAG: hypothetical protein HZA11_06875 [Nitrospirae bacterium]|nr:hypothetical protein [Nitrospirota bacterium]